LLSSNWPSARSDSAISVTVKREKCALQFGTAAANALVSGSSAVFEDGVNTPRRMERLIFWGTPEWERAGSDSTSLSPVDSAQKSKTVDIRVNTNVGLNNVDDHVDSDEGSKVAWPGSCGKCHRSQSSPMQLHQNNH
jgi:hypothetical protein